jgi:spore maturation protein CgeB
MKLKIVLIGLSITSSWGNGHATTYRALAKALRSRGHEVTFLERDVPWYHDHRDLAEPDFCTVSLYRTLPELAQRFADTVRSADCVVLGSYVPQGAAIADWVTSQARGVTAFYDIDTPVTLAGLERGGLDYISPGVIPRFDIYLSFSGGPALQLIEDLYGSPCARPLYCSADPDLHAPVATAAKWSLGYLGTYSDDRQPLLEKLLISPALVLPNERFVIAGTKYPDATVWPSNIERIEHLPPGAHPGFYCSQRFALNITRKDMRALGFSPSVRMFEAAACGVPLISDCWPGLETIFSPRDEILLATDDHEVVEILTGVPEEHRLQIAANARARVLREHTSEHRAVQFESYYREALEQHKPSHTKAMQLAES